MVAWGNTRFCICHLSWAEVRAQNQYLRPSQILVLWCMQVRLGEKQTLDAVLGFFEERIDRLASLEFYQVCEMCINSVSNLIV